MRGAFRRHPDLSVLAHHLAKRHRSLSWRRVSNRIVLNLGRGLKRVMQYRLHHVGGFCLRSIMTTSNPDERPQILIA
jgi:hypothetical protein